MQIIYCICFKWYAKKLPKFGMPKKEKKNIYT